MIKDIVDNIKKQRGERLRLLRKTLGFSRKILCEKYKKYELSAGTIQSWEEARWGGLTEKGAQKLVQAFREEGLEVTVSWLMDGIGLSPVNLRFNSQNKITLIEGSTLSYEIRLFHELHENAVDMMITDDSMLPCLQPGDHVAGKRYYEEKDIIRAIGSICIIEIMSGESLIRLLAPGGQDGLFNLICSNPKTTVTTPNTTDAKLISVAPIMWIRKPGMAR